MSEPRDHHFIPAFLLSRWVDPNNGKLVEYTLRRDKLIAKPVGPRATAFQRDLNRFDELPDGMQQWLETAFLDETDRNASDALTQLEDGKPLTDPKLRSGWSKFVFGLCIRHPDPFFELRERVKRGWKVPDDEAERHYNEIRKENDPETFEKYVETLPSEEIAKIEIRLITKAVLDNAKVGQRLNDFHWEILDTSRARYRLLLSDRPVEISDQLASLPIGPNKLFVAAADRDQIFRLKKIKSSDLVGRNNKFVVSRARRFVFASDTSQEPFLERYMSKSMEPGPFWPNIFPDPAGTGSPEP